MSHNNAPASGLGRSAEDYLEAIHVAGLTGRPVRVTGIADYLSVSKPSVVAALALLEKQGLVRHERYGAVELTPRGALAAEKVYRRHCVLEEFMRDVLGVSSGTAAADACAVEHVLSPETVERLARLVGFLRDSCEPDVRERLDRHLARRRAGRPARRNNAP